MRRWQLLIPVLFFSVHVLGQGIEFEHGTWKEVLEKAKTSNKPIFVDIYTTWCGPCKTMSRDIFPLEEVGKEFNANYVCYKIDAEKGEGVELAKHYDVKAYPTYLFIKPDGTLFYKALGSMPAKKFIEESKKAIVEMNDPKPLSVWEAEYASKKGDPEFLLGYMEKRTKLGYSNQELFDDYLKVVPQSDLMSPKVIELYQKEGQDLKVSSYAYNNLLKNKGAYENAFGDKKDFVKKIISGSIYNSMMSAAKSKNEKELKEVVAANDKLTKEDGKVDNNAIYMYFYKATNNYKKYISYSMDFANSSLLNVTTQQIAEKNKENLKSFEDLIKSGKVDTVKVGAAKIAQARAYYGSMEEQRIAGNLNEIAWTIFENVSEKPALEFALKCSKKSVDLSPNNTAIMDTYASLLYKLGKKQEAIEKQKEILKLAPQESDTYKNAAEIVKKMEAGEKTWKN